MPPKHPKHLFHPLMRLLRQARGGVLALVLALGFAPAVCAAAPEPLSAGAWDHLEDGAIVLLRHAHAPGLGDPAGMRLGDCATQRNLDERGRAQARQIGASFVRRGVRVGAVWTSQWCRARETAELAFPGRAVEQPAFNSFFDDRGREPAQTRAALELLRTWRGPGVLVVATHQVNITALTGLGTGSGEGVVAVVRDGRLQVRGRLGFDP